MRRHHTDVECTRTRLDVETRHDRPPEGVVGHAEGDVGPVRDEEALVEAVVPQREPFRQPDPPGVVEPRRRPEAADAAEQADSCCQPEQRRVKRPNSARRPFRQVDAEQQPARREQRRACNGDGERRARAEDGGEEDDGADRAGAEKERDAGPGQERSPRTAAQRAPEDRVADASKEEVRPEDAWRSSGREFDYAARPVADHDVCPARVVQRQLTGEIQLPSCLEIPLYERGFVRRVDRIGRVAWEGATQVTELMRVDGDVDLLLCPVALAARQAAQVPSLHGTAAAATTAAATIANDAGAGTLMFSGALTTNASPCSASSRLICRHRDPVRPPPATHAVEEPRIAPTPDLRHLE